MEQRQATISRNNAYLLLTECCKKQELLYAQKVQSFMVQRGLDSVSVLGDHLIRLFASFSCLFEANQAFNRVVQPTVYTWSAIISAHANFEHAEIALELYNIMRQGGAESNEYAYVATLRACLLASAHGQMKLLHEEMICSGLQSEVAGNVLVDVYVKCDRIEVARKIFNNLITKNVVSWNTMIVGYSQHAEFLHALDCYAEMQEEGINPDNITFSAVLNVCAGVGATNLGRLIQQQVIDSELQSDIIVGSALVDMLVKFGFLEEAGKAFSKLHEQDEVSWNTMITGFAQYGEGLLTLQCFDYMQEDKIKPNAVTFSGTLKACGIIGNLERGRHIHEHVIEERSCMDVSVENTLVDMYAKCGSLEEAQNVFDKAQNRDVVSWNAMIVGFAFHGEGHFALDCFESMQLEGIKPTGITFVGILKACSSIGSLERDMYAKCGSLGMACRVFDDLINKDVVSWNTLIAACMQHGEDLLALEAFENMQENGLEPNALTFLIVMKVCGNIGAVDKAKGIHKQILKGCDPLNGLLGNTLVDMYSKCGSLKEASEVFTNLQKKNLVSWNAMISGYAEYGDGLLAIECFIGLQQEGFEPDPVTFTGILNVCSRAGLVDEGRWHFERMRACYTIVPDVVHINCLIDLLARGGCFVEAEDVLQSTVQPTASWMTLVSGWTTLLSACREHGNMNIGSKCFDEITRLDSSCTAAYVLMSNLYAANQMVEKALKLQWPLIYADACKNTWAQINNELMMAG